MSETLIKKYSSVKDEINLILKIIDSDYPELENTTKLLRKNTEKETLEEIWNYVKNNFTLIYDKYGYQEYRSLKRCDVDRKGNVGTLCAFTVALTRAVFKNEIKIELCLCGILFNGAWCHVFPVIHLNNSTESIPMDITWKEFGTENPLIKSRKMILVPDKSGQ